MKRLSQDGEVCAGDGQEGTSRLACVVDDGGLELQEGHRASVRLAARVNIQLADFRRCCGPWERINPKKVRG